jgi:sucrose-6-phosphate hydrolase SacC (GH32 family)
VFREPIEDIGQLYAKTHDLKPRPLAPGDNALAGLHPDLLDMDLELELQQAAQVCLTLRAEEIRYDTKAKQLNAFGRSVALEPDDGSLILRVLLDRTSIELFGNRGEVTHSGVFFPSPAHKDLSLTVKGGPARLRRLTVHELESIWPEAPTKP